jgi:hypothetical protein
MVERARTWRDMPEFVAPDLIDEFRPYVHPVVPSAPKSPMWPKSME